MENEDIKNKLIESLSKMYFMEVFNQLTEFLQGELLVLYFLSQNTDMDLSPSIISSKLHMSRPRITATLTTLGKKGFVTTKISKMDRRRVKVILTSKGLSYIEEKRRNIERYFDVFVGKMARKDILELVRLIDLTIDIMSQMESGNEVKS